MASSGLGKVMTVGTCELVRRLDGGAQCARVRFHTRDEDGVGRLAPRAAANRQPGVTHVVDGEGPSAPATPGARSAAPSPVRPRLRDEDQADDESTDGLPHGPNLEFRCERQGTPNGHQLHRDCDLWAAAPIPVARGGGLTRACPGP